MEFKFIHPYPLSLHGSLNKLLTYNRCVILERCVYQINRIGQLRLTVEDGERLSDCRGAQSGVQL